MKKTSKLLFYSLLLSIIVTVYPQGALAESSAEDLSKRNEEKVMLLSEDAGEEIPLYEKKSADTIISYIEDDTVVLLLEAGETFSLVAFIKEGEENEVVQGYVSSKFVIPLSEVNDFRINREDAEDGDEKANENMKEETASQEQQLNPDEETEEPKQPIEVEKETGDPITETEGPLPNEQPAEQQIEQPEQESAGEEIETINEEEKKIEKATDTDEEKLEPKNENLQNASPATFSALQQRTQSGIALKGKTYVYESTSANSKRLKSYAQGHVLKFLPHNATWYAATVYIKGKPHSGYIRKNDVELLVQRKRLEGFALKQPVHVYSGPDKSSTVHKSYSKGHLLKYESLTTNWHKATVYVNGKARTGYIHKSDVGNQSPQLNGIAKRNPTVVYASQSKGSKALKKYKEGHRLIYKALNNNWYSATVFLNGKAHSGYIHKSDIVSSKQSKKGIATNSPTRVYSSLSTSSKALKSYRQGSILQYRAYTDNWYEATVYVNGNKKTGYIRKSHVDNLTSKQKTIRGVALKNSTRVYAGPATNSRTLKSYSFAHGLTYKTLSNNWYEATVYINGKPNTGYIHKNDVMTTTGKTVVLDAGHGGRDPGAQANGLVEKTLNLDIAKRTKSELEKRGFKVIMTRNSDVFLELSDRSKIANNSGADIFISIHGNSFTSSTQGVETFWYGKYEKQNSIKLANYLQDRVVSKTNSR